MSNNHETNDYDSDEYEEVEECIDCERELHLCICPPEEQEEIKCKYCGETNDICECKFDYRGNLINDEDDEEEEELTEVEDEVSYEEFCNRPCECWDCENGGDCMAETNE